MYTNANRIVGAVTRSFTIVCRVVSSMCVLSFSQFVLGRVGVCVYVLCGFTTIAATVYDQFSFSFFLWRVAFYHSYVTVCALFLSLYCVITMSTPSLFSPSSSGPSFVWCCFFWHTSNSVCTSNGTQQTALVDN